MRLWALLAAVLLCSMVLAGCSDDGDGDDGTSSSSSSSSRASSSASSSTSPSTSATTSTTSPPGQPGVEPANTAPVGTMSAVSSALERTINFTLNGTDPEGDNFVWDLTFGDGQATSGTQLPANVSHQYPAVGLYNATFVITDGRLQSAYNLTVNVTAATAASGLFFSGTTSVPCPQCTGGLDVFLSSPVPPPATPIAAPGWNAQEPGIETQWVAITPDLVGKAFTVTATSDAAAAAFPACDPSTPAIELWDASSSETGTIPAGTGCMLLWDFDGPESTVTLVI